ncbi:MAG: NAD(P)/FAD-dependent oxidoreductase [Clostridiales bacterium]|nr:NAD(P)/FAD-dependent oxidoreductase [Clostridiales bacterium]
MVNKTKWDVAIIGCGIAGIFAGYELVKLNPALKVILIEQGEDIDKRCCPIVAKKTKECISCKTCAIMRGFGGAGAYSDGKYNFTAEFGGWLKDYLPEDTIMDLINYVDSVNVSFGATEVVYSTESEEALKLEKKALENDLHLLQAKVKHLGTENNLRILRNIYDFLNSRVTFRFGTSVESIRARSGGYALDTSAGEIHCKYLIAAPGRSGAEWFAGQCRRLGMELLNNQVDIGVRVELPAKVFEHITDVMYESKLVYRTKQYGDHVRTFCMNPYGHVVTENVDGLITVNGHSYSDPKLRSANTNFALLVSNRFTEPFKEPYKYGKHIASLSNMLGGGVLIQRFGDLLRGSRTNEHRLSKSFVKPTLRATPGDLSLVLPKRHMDNIIEMIYALDKIAPGTANYDTLLYGVEVKFYSSRPQLTPALETNLKDFYAIGDGAGVTRGLAQAAASGVIAARSIAEKIKKA